VWLIDLGNEGNLDTRAPRSRRSTLQHVRPASALTNTASKVVASDDVCRQRRGAPFRLGQSPELALDRDWDRPLRRLRVAVTCA